MPGNPLRASVHSLRDRLRRDTAHQHRLADAAYSLDVARREDLGLFLRANLSALDAIRCCRRTAGEAAEKLRREMRVALAADLAHLRGGRAAPLQPCVAEPLAVLYILLGSRAGSRLLGRRWRESSDARVAGAGAYFGFESSALAWRDLRDDLSRLPESGDEADRVVHSARAVFGLYLGAIEANKVAQEP